MPQTYFDRYLSTKDADIIATRDHIEAAARTRDMVPYGTYLLSSLRAIFAEVCSEVVQIAPSDIDIACIDRKDFGGDVTIRIPRAIRESGVREYTATIVPRLVDAITHARTLYPYIEEVRAVGIYINIRLADTHLYESLGQVTGLGERFGTSDLHRGESIIVEYSSPNAAKHLHAGHIRSTIIGHLVGNLSEAVGYTVHRINHLNDWGGIAFIMEGYVRWASLVDATLTGNDLLFFIYGLFRRGQKYAALKDTDTIPETERKSLTKYYGDFATVPEFRERFLDFQRASEARFARLEAGDEEEGRLWEQMIRWSLADFDTFYQILGVAFPYTIGESFYARRGREIVREKLLTGEIVHFTGDIVESERTALRTAHTDGRITDRQYEKLSQEMDRDVGAYLVMLPDFERFVVLKGNESTIYSTRDIATFEYRLRTFHPSKIVHEVGQEQADYFAGLFRASRAVFSPDYGVESVHISHGFYVNAETGAKLSSRDGASSVSDLMNRSIAYFHDKYRDNSEIPETEQEHIARVLGVGSVIYHDIKKDRKSSIGISGDMEKMVRQFEESGGAYIVYASCRAKSILRKYAKPIGAVADYHPTHLEEIETEIIKRIHEFPEIIRRAEEAYNPTILAEYLCQLAQLYNRYYAGYPVLVEGGEYRLIITRAVSQILDNGLRVCGIESLPRI